MTTLGTDQARHATDGDLVRLIDGEANLADFDLPAHVASCDSCSARLELLQQRAGRLSRVLAATAPALLDPQPLRPPSDQLTLARTRAVHRRPAPWSRAGVRAAAALLLLLAGIAAATPARAWILERVSRLRSSAGRSEQSPRTSADLRPTAQASPSTVWFTPSDEELVIRFDARQAEGTLELLAGDDTRSSAQVVSGAKDEGLLVLPSELRIRNGTRSVASYRVVLSPRVRRIRVVTGDGPLGGATVDVTAQMHHVIRLGMTAERR